MIKAIGAYLLTMVISATAWCQEEIYLEGISVLGAQKNAYISMKGGKVAVSEGDAIGMWRVARIEERSVFLTTEEGNATELPLYSRLPISSMSLEEPTTLEILSKDSGTPPAKAEETLAGYHKLHTPFGDFIVEEEEIEKATQQHTTATSESSEAVPELPEQAVVLDNLPQIEAEEVPEGYRKVQTPFGEFLLEEK
jgi:hypothetical protein